MSPTLKKIQSFEQLRIGWHYGQGIPCAPAVLGQALQLYYTSQSLGLYETDAFPALDGGMFLMVYDGAEYFEFRLAMDGLIEYSRETEQSKIDEREGLTLEQAQRILHEYRQEIARDPKGKEGYHKKKKTTLDH